MWKDEVLALIGEVQENDGFRIYSAYSELRAKILEIPDYNDYGYWIESKEGAMCSNCLTRISEIQYKFCSNKFCPNCGAKMLKHMRKGEEK